MAKILVGIDGSERSERALDWAARRAERDGATLKLAAVIDPSLARETGVDEDVIVFTANEVLRLSEERVAESHPGVATEVQVCHGKIVDSMIDCSKDCDLIVVGSHHGATIGEVIGGAKGLRISVSASVPTVVVPSDWSVEREGEGVVAAVGPDGTSDRAVEFAADESVASGQELRLMSVWGLPPVLSRPAEAMGGGLGPVGEQRERELNAVVARLAETHPGLVASAHAVEGAFPATTIAEFSKDAAVLVLGTHSRSAFGRALFGSVSHGVLSRLMVPTVIVPQEA